MTVDEFIQLVRSEPSRTVTRSQKVPSPETLAAVRRRGGMLLTEFLNAPGVITERTATYGHVLGPPVTEAALAAWSLRFALPADMAALLRRMNGIHLWANGATGRSYTGLAPIEEWDRARVKMYGESSDPKLVPDRYIAISYDRDFSAFEVLDLDSGGYYLMDSAGPDCTTPIGANVEQLLDYLWRTRLPPSVR